MEEQSFIYQNGTGRQISREWHIFYLRPRTEGKVNQALAALDYEVFYPFVNKIRIWKNRQKKKIRLPLFPNYLFVHTYPYELHNIRSFPQVVSWVSCAGKPSTLSAEEISGIRRMIGMADRISVEPNFIEGEQVRIIAGPLKGYEGILDRRRNNSRFGIRLKAINHSVFINISTSNLQKINA